MTIKGGSPQLRLSNLHLALMLLIHLFSFLFGHNTTFLQFPNIGLIFSKIFLISCILRRRNRELLLNIQFLCFTDLKELLNNQGILS